MSTLVVLSAVDFEVRPLLDALAGSGRSVGALYTGIGALTAAANAREIANQSKGAHVVYIGTAGTFGEFKEPWLCTASRVCWLPSGERAGISYGIPAGQLPCESLTPDESLGLDAKTVLCSPSISLTRDFAPSWRGMLEPAECIENLELWSCLREIKEKARRIDIIFGITNQVGPDAHAQWKKWHPVAAEMTASHVARWLDEN